MCVRAGSLCAFTWSCYIFHERHVYTNPGRRDRGREKEGGGETVRERVSKEETRERENKSTQQTEIS